MKLSIDDSLIIFLNIASIIMMFMAVLLWIKRRGLRSMLFFLVSFLIYIKILFKALSYYHIINIEVLIKIGNLPLLNYLLDLALILSVIFSVAHLLKQQRINEETDDDVNVANESRNENIKNENR